MNKMDGKKNCLWATSSSQKPQGKKDFSLEGDKMVAPTMFPQR